MNQLDKLKQLSEKMVDVVLSDANPDTWSAAGKKLNDLNTQERGDRYWCGKNANQMITAAVKLETLIAVHERRVTDPSVDVFNDLEGKVLNFENKAKARLQKVVNEK